MKEFIDLHTHSTASDGTFTPTQLVEYAIQKNLKAIALTDHDTIDGLREAEAAAGTALELIPGIELSTTWLDRDVHILGLGIDWKDVYFQEELAQFQQSRDLRNLQMIDLLVRNGIDIDYVRMQEAFPDSVWTRAHFARYLLDHRYVTSMNEAFDRYLGDRACCYVPREKVTPFQAIRMIHACKGAAIFAHPLLCRFSKERLESLTAELKNAGVDGLEAIYATYRSGDEAQVIQLAKRHGLKISGGSDFHGSNKPQIDLGTGKGNLRIPYSVWENLKS